MTGGSLINLGELAKPATVLIERVSDAVGGIAKPWQITRVAKAEAEASKIKALAQFEINEMEQRALERMVRSEAKRQENIEGITAGAIPHLEDNAKPEEIESDWLEYFFEKSKIVSDEEMQSLWSKILAGEANKQKSFSKRTVEIVSLIDKDDAKIFTRLCSYVWRFPQYEPILIKEIDEEPISFSELAHLDDIGLIKHSPLSGYIFRIRSKSFNAHYYGRPVSVELEGDGPYELERGSAMMTNAGRELAPISGGTPDFGYFDRVLEQWISRGQVSISTTIASKPTWNR